MSFFGIEGSERKDQSSEHLISGLWCLFVCFFRTRASSPCPCPANLAFGTVDSVLGKFRAIFNESGSRRDWDPRRLVGNPSTNVSLKQYLKAVTAEQLQAQATPEQAIPCFASLGTTEDQGKPTVLNGRP